MVISNLSADLYALRASSYLSFFNKYSAYGILANYNKSGLVLPMANASYHFSNSICSIIKFFKSFNLRKASFAPP